MKSIYSKNTKLNNLVRAALGLPFVPIERIQNGEAMNDCPKSYTQSHNLKHHKK